MAKAESKATETTTAKDDFFSEGGFETVGLPRVSGWYSPDACDKAVVRAVIAGHFIRPGNNGEKPGIVLVAKLTAGPLPIKSSEDKDSIIEAQAGDHVGISIGHSLKELMRYAPGAAFKLRFAGKKALAGGRKLNLFDVVIAADAKKKSAEDLLIDRGDYKAALTADSKDSGEDLPF